MNINTIRKRLFGIVNDIQREKNRNNEIGRKRKYDNHQNKLCYSPNTFRPKDVK